MLIEVQPSPYSNVITHKQTHIIDNTLTFKFASSSSQCNQASHEHLAFQYLFRLPESFDKTWENEENHQIQHRGAPVSG